MSASYHLKMGGDISIDINSFFNMSYTVLAYNHKLSDETEVYTFQQFLDIIRSTH